MSIPAKSLRSDSPHEAHPDFRPPGDRRPSDSSGSLNEPKPRHGLRGFLQSALTLFRRTGNEGAPARPAQGLSTPAFRHDEDRRGPVTEEDHEEIEKLRSCFRKRTPEENIAAQILHRKNAFARAEAWGYDYTDPGGKRWTLYEFPDGQVRKVESVEYDGNGKPRAPSVTGKPRRPESNSCLTAGRASPSIRRLSSIARKDASSCWMSRRSSQADSASQSSENSWRKGDTTARRVSFRWRRYE